MGGRGKECKEEGEKRHVSLKTDFPCIPPLCVSDRARRSELGREKEEQCPLQRADRETSAPRATLPESHIDVLRLYERSSKALERIKVGINTGKNSIGPASEGLLTAARGFY